MEQALESDSDLEEAIVELKKQFAAQGWDDLNEGRYLGIKFWGVGDSRYETDARVKKLRTPLKKLGYGITEEHREFDQSQQFETREDAEKFLHDTGTRINDHLNCLKVQKARKFIAIYPIHDDDWKDFEKAKILVSQSASANLDDEAVSQKAKLLQHDLQAGFMSPKSAFGPKFKLRPGALVTPIGDRLWSIDLPTRYTAQAYRRLASIIKVSSGSAGLELVRAKQTAGINYSVSNQMVLAKLKDWHEKYGISVSEASSDSMTVRFKKPPNDLTQLCTEFVTFCPDLVDGCEADNANAIKDIAAKLRETNVIEFWWD
jgi:hypothetical protein